MVGIDALQDPERVLLSVSRLVREEFLRQSAFSAHDASCAPRKAYWMLKAFLAFLSLCRDLLKNGVSADSALALPIRDELGRMKELPADGFRDRAEALIARIDAERGG